ncbi:5-formyltetrahydrofolate cyclo-ligase [Chlamydia psittaci]|uniref:5-formyltetrahydrofolate cyclo-ligase n=1 Tax=Chlamydia psittaci 99DC5 TaxID=1112251 RepID=A0ABN0MQ38_CHLPS|nr:5-formyltetrahydrofolate cyclo-ligase [Chlamydia psittaci]AFS23271.1 5-formyltetrahydrofolate cyclo-ligase [Chlamydia psittaci VS225]AGE75573.1 5-formyltetrahydrofolate cyclo-ligase [Chlamydia psittaci Mat116]EPJ15802.1 5-formyltetrahydrofolate cyclo-ligase [Chlamydia psittaci 02DC18]EPJ17342.1 5-formyltetrahydrofolate cyclo-ligase [Chlamydia psittaci 02DC22]EPJ19661.1 5-formyltetrahydrofolate cyclo-ligase [Chlamydia psittaci 02DC23]EPJ20767.1 5-formyltetrahydrofolate cyclo-ligase [Chlamyd
MDTSVTTDKNKQREFFSSLRQSIQEPRLSQASQAIAAFVRLLPKGSCVLSFVPFRSEININLANQILIEDFSLALPKIDNHELTPVLVSSLNTLSKIVHPLRISEFNLHCISPQDITHVLVPGLAFDNDNYRLGYGGGCYDRWLANYPHLISIGVGFREQKTPILPRESHDIPLSQLFLA